MGRQFEKSVSNKQFYYFRNVGNISALSLKASLGTSDEVLTYNLVSI
jgi:hypothetical protein